MRFFFVFCFLSTATLRAEEETPFLTFEDATLSVSRNAVISRIEKRRGVYFPILSKNAPTPTRNVKRYYSKKAERIDGDLLLIVDDNVTFVRHYFHFTEHLIGIWNFLTCQDPDSVKMAVIAFQRPSSEDASWVGISHETTRLLLTSLFPGITVKLLSELPADVDLKAHKIHLSSRVRSHGIPVCGRKNMNASVCSSYRPERLRQMRDRIFENMKIKMDVAGPFPRITYCKRSGTRTMNPAVEQELLKKIAEEAPVPIKVVDFAQISFREQLELVANTDLFIGVHGNGLTHLLFLPDHAAVLEYYEGGESSFYRLYAQMRGVKYFGNSHNRWVTEAYQSLKNRQPYSQPVSDVDLETTLKVIRTLKAEN